MDKTTAEEMWRQSTKYYAEGRYRKAADLLRQLAENFPENQSVLTALSRCEAALSANVRDTTHAPRQQIATPNDARRDRRRRIWVLIAIAAVALIAILAIPSLRMFKKATSISTTLPASRAAGEEATFAGIRFVWCPPGKLVSPLPPDKKIYSKSAWRDVEGHDHEGEWKDIMVTFERGFWLSKFEITQAQWKNVMGQNPSFFQEGNTTDNRPVESVSWNDVQDFLRRINQINPTMQFRLPSDSEWHYAYLAGASTRFYWGDDTSAIHDYAWVDGSIHDVGGKKPNAWGFYDMSGNVSEWVQDKFHWNHDVPSDGSAWEPAEADPHYRMKRGGFSQTSPDYWDSCGAWGFEPFNGPDEKSQWLGFRLLKPN